MTNLLVSISSKYIHTNLAAYRLKSATNSDVFILEFTIKHELDFIINEITAKKPTTIAFSTYIWNIEVIKKIIPEIKRVLPNTKIILGGPEVSYEIDYFFGILPIDFIIRNEGEIAYNSLLSAIENNNTDLSDIPNLAYLENGILKLTKLEEIKDLDALPSAFHIEDTIAHIKNKIQYIETSRGCPFRCSYCMASLEKTVRYFSLDRVKKDILFLMENGARVFKFLDRTFNTKIDYALEMFKFLIENHKPGVNFQFEITLDILDPKIIHFLNENAPRGLFRFEVGIQSTNVETNKLVYRIQDNKKLFNNIMLIKEADIIDLHLDLIAGLPKEDIVSFENTFNEVFATRPKELQLGFLKLLRGTTLKKEKDLYGYIYDEKAPYQIKSNDVLSNEDLHKIHSAEEALEKFWNSGFMVNTLNYIFENHDNPFKFFMELGEFYESKYSWHNYQLDELFIRFYEFAEKFNFEYTLDYLKLDYFKHSKVKPKIWWADRLSKETKNYILRNYFEEDKTIKLNTLYKYAIVDKFKESFIIVVYQPDKKDILIYG